MGEMSAVFRKRMRLRQACSGKAPSGTSITPVELGLVRRCPGRGKSGGVVGRPMAPVAKRPPTEVWINKPDAAQLHQEPLPNQQEPQPVPMPSDETRSQPSGTFPKGVQAGVAPHLTTQNSDVPLL